MIRNLQSTGATSRSITLTWDELSCVDHNGILIGYRIEYGTMMFDSMEIATGTSITVNGLLPLTTYMFRVAAVNGNGTSPYGSTINSQTSVLTVLTAGIDSIRTSQSSKLLLLKSCALP